MLALHASSDRHDYTLDISTYVLATILCESSFGQQWARSVL